MWEKVNKIIISKTTVIGKKTKLNIYFNKEGLMTKELEDKFIKALMEVIAEKYNVIIEYKIKEVKWKTSIIGQAMKEGI